MVVALIGTPVVLLLAGVSAAFLERDLLRRTKPELAAMPGPRARGRFLARATVGYFAVLLLIGLWVGAVTSVLTALWVVFAVVVTGFVLWMPVVVVLMRRNQQRA